MNCSSFSIRPGSLFCRLIAVRPSCMRRSIRLRKAATPIPTNDMWIAASALQHNLSLYTLDRHFHAVIGLRSGESLSELEST